LWRSLEAATTERVKSEESFRNTAKPGKTSKKLPNSTFNAATPMELAFLAITQFRS
jgi:hypothetical protein